MISIPEVLSTALQLHQAGHLHEAEALRVAQNLAELRGLRKRLAKNRLTMPIFENARFARRLERAYQEMWDIYCKEEAPRRISESVRSSRTAR